MHISAADLPELVRALGDITMKLAVILGMSALSWQAHAGRPRKLPALKPAADIRHPRAMYQANTNGICKLILDMWPHAAGHNVLPALNFAAGTSASEKAHVNDVQTCTLSSCKHSKPLTGQTRICSPHRDDLVCHDLCKYMLNAVHPGYPGIAC